MSTTAPPIGVHRRASAAEKPGDRSGNDPVIASKLHPRVSFQGKPEGGEPGKSSKLHPRVSFQGKPEGGVVGVGVGVGVGGYVYSACLVGGFGTLAEALLVARGLQLGERRGRAAALRDTVRLGRLMLDVRETATHGQWRAWLTNLGINRERARRAMEIARAISDEHGNITRGSLALIGLVRNAGEDVGDDEMPSQRAIEVALGIRGRDGRRRGFRGGTGGEHDGDRHGRGDGSGAVGGAGDGRDRRVGAAPARAAASSASTSSAAMIRAPRPPEDWVGLEVARVRREDGVGEGEDGGEGAFAAASNGRQMAGGTPAPLDPPPTGTKAGGMTAPLDPGKRAGGTPAPLVEGRGASGAQMDMDGLWAAIDAVRDLVARMAAAAAEGDADSARRIMHEVGMIAAGIAARV